MTRPAHVQIDTKALLHNLNQVKQHAPGCKIIAMVKANAYGCGLSNVVPVLAGKVDAFGVACLEEAVAIRKLGVQSECVLFQGMFSADELQTIVNYKFQFVIHQSCQLQWLLAKPLPDKIKVWVKVDSGMHRLGFMPEEVHDVVAALAACPWVDAEIGLLSHFACADEIENPVNQTQLSVFQALKLPPAKLVRSMANSAALLDLPEAHFDVVRPGIMLYGVSPFSNQVGQTLGLLPVMRFVSAISAIHHYPADTPIGYGGVWRTTRPSIIGVVAAGYGDGYPRHIKPDTPVWVKGYRLPIVGRVSMDMLTVDLTDCPEVTIGDAVELWGQYIPVETIAHAAGTIAYELLCQFSPRVLQES
ncbi:alanine racemase [Legionella fairfieldensis]|uniref:alanine racemase n=1 Tax=Legionella fairfieldensis TaxID=45064 RepID=UPI00048E3CD0|nr:alanine racemase [Legionella fairfieldensis]